LYAAASDGGSIAALLLLVFFFNAGAIVIYDRSFEKRAKDEELLLALVSIHLCDTKKGLPDMKMGQKMNMQDMVS
jgi:hypothetical protein